MSFALDPRLAAESVAVGDFNLSQLRLMDDARFPWLILVPRIAGARELIDLDEGDRASLLGEVTSVGRALETLLAPHKLNVAALGNVVSQLHVHVVARYTDDAAWPQPVWGCGERVAYTHEAREGLLTRLREALRDTLTG